MEGLWIVLFSLVAPFEGQRLNSFIADCSFWPSLLLKLENHVAENVIAGPSLTELSICQN